MTLDLFDIVHFSLLFDVTEKYAAVVDLDFLFIHMSCIRFLEINSRHTVAPVRRTLQNLQICDVCM